MFDHKDTLDILNQNLPIGEKLANIHKVMKTRFGFIDRVAVAIYDEKTDLLKTFVHSSGNENPLTQYQSTLSDSPSLQDIVDQRKPRLVNDLSIFANGVHEHTKRIAQQGYSASYTLPMFSDDEFFGFIFFNSYERDVFSEESLYYFDIIGHLISLMVINEQTSVRTLLATVKVAHDMTHHRDMETGAHIDRMSRYSRIIARNLAPSYNLDDEYVESIFLFSPLHDIGKISIADKILKKPGKLSDEEFRIMQTHASKGRKIIDDMLEDQGLHSFENISILRNIAEHHHEAINGTGYPHGLKDGDIPLEARIVAVADVFDALTSKRPYKEAWTNKEAYAMLQRLAGEKLDKDCVKALMANQEEVEIIQQEFQEDNIG
jgi:HD-GYP domain-containing protein (c-di-GMP phosphodiesterase class II)